MLNSINIDGRTFELDGSGPLDISIPLIFNGDQPNAYGVEPARSEPCEAGDLVGDTRRGGSCNFEQYTFIPHCNGTHTECVGHITKKRISVQSCLRDVFMTATVITVEPVYASDTDETYSIAIDAGDRLLKRKKLETTKLRANRALIVRTLPNDDRKKTRRYLDPMPPYFTTEAMALIAELGYTHLLVDLPSIDRLFDEGNLSNHRIFWSVEPKSFETNADTRLESTITELIYVPNDIADGEYLLNLQIAPFAADATPSRPLLFRIAKN
jgi:kynurenine formamidase